MITAMLSGNLGNHMFNYAIVRAIAKRTGYQYSFDPIPKYDYYGGKEQMDFLDIDYGPFPTGIVNQYYEKKIIHNHAGDKVNIQIYDANVFNILDNTELIGGCWQSEQYYSKADLKDWFKIRKSHESSFKSTLQKYGIILDNDTCIINIRGGEYTGISQLLINRNYYINAMNYMKQINPNMHFIVVTDDTRTASTILPGIPHIHISIGCDYYILNQAKWLILANSSFSIIPTLLNANVNKVIAPKYWARHNTSDGYWAIGDQYYSGWYYLDRDGKMQDYAAVKSEALAWRKTNGYY